MGKNKSPCNTLQCRAEWLTELIRFSSHQSLRPKGQHFTQTTAAVGLYWRLRVRVCVRERVRAVAVCAARFIWGRDAEESSASVRLAITLKNDTANTTRYDLTISAEHEHVGSFIGAGGGLVRGRVCMCSAPNGRKSRPGSAGRMFQLGKAARSEPERRESTDSARRGGQRALEHCRAVGRRREYRSVHATSF